MSLKCDVNLEVFPVTIQGSYPADSPEAINSMQKSSCTLKNLGYPRGSTQVLGRSEIAADLMCGNVDEKGKPKTDVAGCAELASGQMDDQQQQKFDKAGGNEHLKSAGGSVAASIVDVSGRSAAVASHEGIGHSEMGWPNGSKAGNGIGDPNDKNEGGGEGSMGSYTPVGCAQMQRMALANDGSHSYDPSRTYYYTQTKDPKAQWPLGKPLWEKRQPPPPPKDPPPRRDPPPRIAKEPPMSRPPQSDLPGNVFAGPIAPPTSVSPPPPPSSPSSNGVMKPHRKLFTDSAPGAGGNPVTRVREVKSASAASSDPSAGSQAPPADFNKGGSTSSIGYDDSLSKSPGGVGISDSGGSSVTFSTDSISSAPGDFVGRDGPTSSIGYDDGAKKGGVGGGLSSEDGLGGSMSGATGGRGASVGGRSSTALSGLGKSGSALFDSDFFDKVGNDGKEKEKDKKKSRRRGTGMLERVGRRIGSIIVPNLYMGSGAGGDDSSADDSGSGSSAE